MYRAFFGNAPAGAPIYNGTASIVGVASASGVGSATFHRAGSVTAIATATGVGTVWHAGAASIAGIATATGAGSVAWGGQASVFGVATATGDGTFIGTWQGAASIVGVAVVAAVGTFVSGTPEPPIPVRRSAGGMPFRPPWEEGEPLTDAFQDEIQDAFLRLQDDEELLLWIA